MIDAVLAARRIARQRAEELMTARFRITRPGAPTVTDYTPTASSITVYEGIGKIQTYEGHEGGRTLSESSVVVQRSSIHIPVGAARCQPGDLAECLASTDPLLVGRRWRIAQTYPVKEHATSYRLFVDELLEG